MRDDTDYRQLLERLAAHLEATEELPVSPSASPWLGEAHAVAADLAAAVDGDETASTVEEDVLETRLGHVRHLLESTGSTGNDAADERVRAALDVLDELERS